VPRRHELEDAWRRVVRAELNRARTLARSLTNAPAPLRSADWLTFWADLRGLACLRHNGRTHLASTADVYAHRLGIYLGQLDLPLDDAWRSDLAWAMRAPPFDVAFPNAPECRR
jgi:hypothetical protein